jgi:RNA polymerase sigma-70 factor (ECF subfamily)
VTDPEINDAIESVLAGRPEGFSLLVRRFGLVVRGYLHARVHHAEDAEDLAQEVFITAYRDLKSFRRGESFQAWLLGIARNRLLTHMRSAGRKASALERFREEIAVAVENELDEFEDNIRSELLERLLSCIDSLPARMRRVVKAGLSTVKAGRLAAELGTSPGAIYTLQWRANKLLRQCMNPKT